MPRWLSPSKQKLLKALIKGSVLLPYHAASETASSLSRTEAFRFGAAHSAKPLLSTAVVECVNAVRAQLGPNRHPHFCQLLVTAEAHGSHIEYAPSVSLCNSGRWLRCMHAYTAGSRLSLTCCSAQFVQECFSSKENEAPVVIGGAVQGLLANQSRNVAGVSLFAAHMPGMHDDIDHPCNCFRQSLHTHKAKRCSCASTSSLMIKVSLTRTISGTAMKSLMLALCCRSKPWT